jgi:predicted nucleotidyltransferase
MKNLDVAKLRDYLSSRKDIAAAYLFGSYASKRPGPQSDIDIAVLLDRAINRKDYGVLKLNVITDLIRILSSDAIDVVILNAATPLLAHEVIKKGKLLFSKDEKGRLEYTVKATMRYLDTIHLRKVQDRILHEKIRRRDFGYFKGSRKYSIETLRQGASDTPAVK